jgi:putative heme-binding domain-containing protein
MHAITSTTVRCASLHVALRIIRPILAFVGFASIIGLANGFSTHPYFATASAQPTTPPSAQVFDIDNLVAWCIVPFDAARRTPQQRAAMLRELGLRRLAYDYRAEHVPQFEEEIQALQEHDIELTAWWFPTTLNDEAKQILSLLAKHHIKTQLWVMGDRQLDSLDEPTRIAREVERLRPIADAAAAIGCQVGLYNHGGWYGQPENLVKMVAAVNRPNVGIVYNLHHAHDRIDAFAASLAAMKPHLLAINLNGMEPDGEAIGKKILPIGEGSLDPSLIATIRDSGFRGPIGILNHTDLDARDRLQQNLRGLRTIVASLPALPNDVAAWIERAKADGDPLRGASVFATACTSCLSCHRIESHGGMVGPELTAIAKQRSPEQLVASVLWPNRELESAYQPIQLILDDGRSVQGYGVQQGATSISLRDPTSGQVTEYELQGVESQTTGKSLMPEGLVAALTEPQWLDLIAFLVSLRGSDPGRSTDEKQQWQGMVDAIAAAQGVQPASFQFNRDPLRPDRWPHWQAEVNRDRLYDFYTKQAIHLRGLSQRPKLAMEFPGLDQGIYGHWGNQNEESWADDRWQKTDFGSLQCGVFFGPDPLVIPRGICFRLGDALDTSVALDPDTLRIRSIWRGGLVQVSSVRGGFLDGIRPPSEASTIDVAVVDQAQPQHDSSPTSRPRFQGLLRHGPQVAILYAVGSVQWKATVKPQGDSVAVESVRFDPASDAAKQTDLAAQWPQSFTTPIVRGSGQPLTIDTIELPETNPWNALLSIGDHAFLADGSAMVCTMQGDVWHATGLDGEQAVWRRFASGLHHPLGLWIDADGIFVLGRDQITRLHDRNGDGEAEHYECYASGFETSTAGHDYIAGLQRDRQGRFYTASGNQGILRIAADGQATDIIATGFRNPDGLGLRPDGLVTVPCSEGEWTPTSMICAIGPNEMGVGSAAPFFGYRGPKEGQSLQLPMVYLPRGIDNSSGGQVFVDSAKWVIGQGQMIHTSFGAGAHFLLLDDVVDGQHQGAVMPLPGEFLSGAHRARFHPIDGQLYVSGMGGWGTYTPRIGCFHRVRFTGPKPNYPVKVRAHENGVAIALDQPIESDRILDPSSVVVQSWNYRYSAAYGSAEFSALYPPARGHDVLTIDSIRLLDDRKTVFIELPQLQPVNQLHLHVAGIGDEPIDLFCTVHRLASPRTDLPGYRAAKKTIAPHPIERDLATLRQQVPNPWRERIPNSHLIDIEAGKNLAFATRELRVKAGEPVKITLYNPDVVPHNWALVKPGRLQAVGERANRLISDPEAVAMQYVPRSDDVICYTNVVEPQEETAIYFHAPTEPGQYPYLCTFPGHWMVMNGVLIVEPATP